MITFLWMLYLAFTIYLSWITIGDLITIIFLTKKGDTMYKYKVLGVAILWSIWYFLH